MTGWIRPWRARVARTAAAAAIGLGSAPATGLAADPPAPVVVPGSTEMAVTADIDGDGAREVARLAGAPNERRIEVWDFEDGAWVATFSTDVAPLTADGSPGGVGWTPVTLARARLEDAERVLALVSGFDPETGMPGCCLAIHELVDRGRGPEMRALAVPDVEAESVVILDIDGDGTDELAATLIRWEENGTAATTDLELLRREGDGWSSTGAWEEDGPWWVMLPAESDGLPGHELFASGETGEVVRLSWVDGALSESRSKLSFDGQQGWVNGGTTGALIVALPTAVGLVEWPAGGEPVLVASYETRDYPTIGMLGSGADRLFVVQDHDGSGTPTDTVHVLDSSLEPLGEVTMSPQATALWDRVERMFRGGWSSSRSIWPYVGPADGEWTGAGRSYLVGGVQIEAGRGGTFEARPTRALVMHPIGAAGPDDAWVALMDGGYWTGLVSYLGYGGLSEDSRLTLAPAAGLLEPVAQGMVTEVTYEGAIELGRADEDVSLLVAPTGGEIAVSVAPETVVISWDGSTATDHGSRDLTVRLEVPAPRRLPRDRLAEFEREVMLIGPEGNVEFLRWEGTFAPEAPDLTSWSRVEPLSLEAIVAGRTAPRSTVTVDGRAVPVNDFGAYRATVDAPPWPRNVTVVARDPFGGEQRTTVEVIGLVDYRGLPWVPIAGAATVIGGGVLFLRTPKHRPLAAGPTPDEGPLDDGHLEDLDDDLI